MSTVFFCFFFCNDNNNNKIITNTPVGRLNNSHVSDILS